MWGEFSKYKPRRGGGGGLYLDGQFNEGFFALLVLGGLYLEGLIFGILRYNFALELQYDR